MLNRENGVPMSKCSKCGTNVPVGVKCCVGCGSLMSQTKECPQCHAQCPSDKEFCGKCGCPLNISDIGTTLTDSAVGGREQGVISDDANPSIPFYQIRSAIVEFKRKYKCKDGDIVLSEQSDFSTKWENLTKCLSKIMGKNVKQDDAIAIIDCTALGSCEHGALVDKSGIYMVNEDTEMDGWLDWKSFIEKADIARNGLFELRICSQPIVALNISRCNFNTSQAIELFGSILDKASRGKAHASQVHAISLWGRMIDGGCSCFVYIIIIALLGVGTYVLHHYFDIDVFAFLNKVRWVRWFLK